MIQPHTRVIVEASKKFPFEFPATWTLLKEKVYGVTAVYTLQQKEGVP